MYVLKMRKQVEYKVSMKHSFRWQAVELVGHCVPTLQLAVADLTHLSGDSSASRTLWKDPLTHERLYGIMFQDMRVIFISVAPARGRSEEIWCVPYGNVSGN